MYIFISMPPKKCSLDELQAIKIKIATFLQERGHVGTFGVTRIFKDTRVQNEQMWRLGEEIQAFSYCDAVLFCTGWEKDKKCRLEHEVCIFCGIKIYYSVNEL